MNRSTIVLKAIGIAIILVSCLNSTSNPENNTQFSESQNNLDTSSKSIQKRAIKYFPIKDTQNNMLMAVMPIPVDWKLSDNKKENVFLESPKGVKTYHTIGNMYTYSQDPGMNHFFSQRGMEIKALQSFEQVLEELKGIGSKGGLKLINQYELPQLTEADKNLDRLLLKTNPEQKTIRVVATEWVDNKGITSIAIIHYVVVYVDMFMQWGYTIESMDAPKDYFPTARRDYINALLNTQINPKWIQILNEKARQNQRRQLAGHQNRMEALRSQGDQIIANGKQHDAMTTRAHQKFMDGLNDRVSVTNPSNGQNYNVALGSNHYWISDNNQLITSDNANYNPNGNLNNNSTWVEAQINN